MTVIVLVLLSGCGTTSGGGARSSSQSSSQSSSPSVAGNPSSTEGSGATYFTNTESDAINAVARPAQAAATRALTAANESRCNRLGSKGYAVWRACWHALLDPYAQGLRAIAAELGTLQVGEFPAGCLDGLKAADSTFRGFAQRVDRLLAGFDSNKRAAQVKAINGYTSTIRTIETGYSKPFQAVTRVCYSPEQLKKLDASTSASPSP